MTLHSRLTTLESGNASEANASSRGWFVGDLAAWAAERGESFDPSSTPRQSADVQVKWFVHPPGHSRADGIAGADQHCYPATISHSSLP